MKVDTQGMSFGSGKSGRSIQEQRDAIPPMKVNKMNLLSDALKVELKDLCLLYTSPSPRDSLSSRMPSSA